LLAVVALFAGCGRPDPNIPRVDYSHRYQSAAPDPAGEWDLGWVGVPLFRDWTPLSPAPVALEGGAYFRVTGVLLPRFPESESARRFVFVELFDEDGTRLNFLAGDAAPEENRQRYDVRIVVPRQSGQYECVVRLGIDDEPPNETLARGMIEVN
jgi:hypothetical protein